MWESLQRLQLSVLSTFTFAGRYLWCHVEAIALIKRNM